MNTITKKELLDYWLYSAKEIMESQCCEIDNDYFLLDINKWGVDLYPKEKLFLEPIIEIDDNLEHIVVIRIKYEYVPTLKLIMSKPKFVFRNKEVYFFNKVID
jgi:hypothetical protein